MANRHLTARSESDPRVEVALRLSYQLLPILNSLVALERKNGETSVDDLAWPARLALACRCRDLASAMMSALDGDDQVSIAHLQSVLDATASLAQRRAA